MKSTFFSVQKKSSAYFKNTFSDSMYHIFLFNGNGKIIVDFIEYNFIGKTVFFTSPFQNIQILSETEIEIEVLNFHGDFYCIEFHKKEVACNGLLFNNIYLFPHFSLTDEVYQEISDYFSKIKEVNHNEDFSGSVLQSYLQLILAISSREKNKLLPDKEIIKDDFNELKLFQNLVEEHFIVEKSLSFYADLLHVTSNTLSKKIKSKFNKTPSQIIQERVILEAKKQIHLTRKSIKEIAVELNFNDEFHFSKYFKKYVGISPTQFRKETGISIVADLYK
ncbi:helix-turn-helix domain-containing protein [Chryseobacterium indoltheticum]|uniref:helix-turn-helix domain-containing protein n=1 Tax=Chryseobacterium indoltheticum TaxID=254 RepID=UPI002431A77E|nr:helix-turn-helix domain-containing protein [Chryseobacterium indoltheticum]MDF2831940.1 AraC family transcriptional regulator [Chryseobacterium indoltheticum]